MPVRSLHSSVLKWPDGTAVDRGVREWARRIGTAGPRVLRIGYFGSYARGEWGVGSDVDVVMIVERSEEPFERRAAHWDTTKLPVPADLLVYTVEEWERLKGEGAFARRADREAVWVYEAGEASGGSSGVSR